MAFGRHWEWRSFGIVSPQLAERISALPLMGLPFWLVTDTYLWSERTRVNIKLRHGVLKIKRLLEKREELEYWLEDEDEVHPFPLTAEVLARLEEALAVHLPARATAPLDLSDLPPLLRAAEPPVHEIVVRKRRRLHYLLLASGEKVRIDFAEISEPETITTVALEHERAAAVRAALQMLQIERADLKPLNYLEALGIWARGQRIL